MSVSLVSWSPVILNVAIPSPTQAFPRASMEEFRCQADPLILLVGSTFVLSSPDFVEYGSVGLCVVPKYRRAVDLARHLRGFKNTPNFCSCDTCWDHGVVKWQNQPHQYATCGHSWTGLQSTSRYVQTCECLLAATDVAISGGQVRDAYHMNARAMMPG